MNYSLGERHLMIASHTQIHCVTSAWVLEESSENTLSRTDIAEHVRDHLDFTDAISGDDLARINAFEPKREPRLWADVTTHGLADAA